MQESVLDGAISLQIDLELRTCFPVIVDAIKVINMRPKEPQNSNAHDLFRSRPDPIVDMSHPLAKLARVIDWGFLEESFGAVYADTPGCPSLSTQLMTSLAILMHMQDLSD